ncbi:MAG: GNAT family N-acetyltransferase [Candidatus Binataceae bacterium]
MSVEFRIIEIHDRAQIERAHAIRRRVFIEEQHVPEELELDEDDARALHVLALDASDTAVGCGRMVAHGDEVKIGRMAVLRERRGQGIGRRILEFLMEAAKARGYCGAMLHAQVAVEGFYRKSGYRSIGDVFEEAGIMHRLMRRDL